MAKKVLVATIRSNDVTAKFVKKVKKQLRKAAGKKYEVVVVALAPEDSLDLARV